MAKVCIKVDTDLCQGHGVCHSVAPELFELVDDGGAYPMVKLLIECPPDELIEKAQKAEAYCPNGVISVTEIE